MKKRLPVPIFLNEKLYTEINFKKPTGNVIAQTKDLVDNSGVYLAMRDFIFGCAESLVIDDGSEITDGVSLKSLVFKMPIKSAEYIAQEIMIYYYNGEDFIEGIYYCPFCNTKSVARLTDDSDTRDRISDLEVNFCDGKPENIDIQFDKPLEIDIKNDIYNISNITIKIPTLENHHNAYVKYGDNNLVRYQLAVYADCLVKINGIDVDQYWKESYNIKIFNESDELKHITDTIGKNMNCFGVDPRLKKFCKKCSEVWQPVINTSNFFGSALQLS